MVELVSQINERMLLGWQRYLSQKHLRHKNAEDRSVQTTLARKLSSVSSLLEFALKRKLIDTNPAKLLKRPKIKRESRTNAFTWDELKAMLAHCEAKRDFTAQENNREHRSWTLRYAVLATLFSVGMRAQELCDLRIGDLEVTKEFAKLHLKAKGNESHSPIIHDNTRRILESYMAQQRQGAHAHEPLFVRAQRVHDEKPLTQAALFDMILTVSKAMGLQKKVSPHSCRATLATLLHNQGVPIGQIQDLLNHKQITTTAIYLKKAQELEESAALKIDILKGF